LEWLLRTCPVLRVRPVLVLATVLLVATAGCTRGRDREEASSQATTTAPAPVVPTVAVKASAKGSGSGAALAKAAASAAPELDLFLTRYLTVAFSPAAARDGFPDFSRFFNPDLREAVVRDLASLSLGRAGGGLTGVRTDPASARAVFLIEGARPLAATVSLRMSGSATGPGGQLPISLQLVLALERGAQGWKIASYDSKAEVPA
jgi:hypothetical protein